MPRVVQSVHESKITHQNSDYFMNGQRPQSFPFTNLGISSQPFERAPQNLDTPPALEYRSRQSSIKSRGTSFHGNTNLDQEPLVVSTSEIVSPNDQISQTSDNHTSLPDGWEHAYDDEGTIYYFNEQTGESRWDKPAHPQNLSGSNAFVPDKEENALASKLDNMLLSPTIGDDFGIQSNFQKLKPSELKQLELDQLHSEWIRHQGFVQMKMRAEKEDGGKLSSWKMYYAVLSNGFLLLYKESYSKGKKPAKPLVPVGGFDLDSCHIDPANKHDTRRKNVFTITTKKKVKIYIQTSHEKEFSIWLDTIMRDLVARREAQKEESDIIRLLRMLTSDSNQLKVNRKIETAKETDEKDRRYRIKSDTDDHRTRPKKLGHWFSKSGKEDERLEAQHVVGQTESPAGNDVFGGFIRLDDDGKIPRILRQCVKEVERRGLDSVGIYRISGHKSSVQKYRAQFNRNEDVHLEEESDINVVASLLKLYFRELRNPLLTYEYYDWFIDAARILNYDERMFRIKSIIHVLPKSNYVIMEFLMRHLSLVSLHSEVNKMEPSNLALIFSVGLLRTAAEDFSSIMQADLQSKIIEAVIQQVDWFFDADDQEEELVNVEP
ncbi:Rho GTPase activation protein [Phycomyces nitens]|nr:Rho GTPase activation protein [Phycomyces nitens]